MWLTDGGPGCVLLFKGGDMSVRNIGRYQVICWFPKWAGFSFKRLDPKETGIALIYEWIAWILFWEIRKWTKTRG